MIIQEFKPNSDMMFNLKNVKAVLSADIADAEPTMWAMCDPINGGDTYVYRALKNGDSVPDEMIGDYTATMVISTTNEVWHLFGRKVNGKIARR